MLARQTFTAKQGPPFAFSLAVSAASVDPRATLSLFADIRDGRRQLYVADSPNTVPAQGAKGLELRLRFVASARGEPASGVLTPSPGTYRCGEETFKIAFESLRAFSPTWTDDQLRLRAEWLPTCDERAITAAYAGFHDDDIHSDLARISTPMRLIAAGRGDVIRPDELDEIRTLAPRLEVCRVDGAGHMIPWDDFNGFFRAFGTFLGRPLEEE